MNFIKCVRSGGVETKKVERYEDFARSQYLIKFIKQGIKNAWNKVDCHEDFTS